MRALGAWLREAREAAGLSLRQLSLRTKITESILDAIEHDDFTRVPTGPFRKGFLRAIAHETGLDPEAIVQHYALEFEPPPEPVSTNSINAAQSSSLADGGAGLGRTAAAMVVGAVVVTVVVFFVVVYLFPKIDPDRQQPEAPAVATASDWEAEPVSYVQDASTTVPMTAVSQPANGLILEVDPTGPVWVAASADGQRVLYEIVYPGQRRAIQALEQFAIRIGDAGAFQYSLNGLRGRALGGATEVLDVRITRENYRTFQAQ